MRNQNRATLGEQPAPRDYGLSGDNLWGCSTARDVIDVGKAEELLKDILQKDSLGGFTSFADAIRNRFIEKLFIDDIGHHIAQN